MAELPAGLVEALADRYTVERELGRGGMATVYLARDLRHDRMVALKVMRPELAAAIGNERFLREIQIAARLQHSHVLPLYDSGEVGEQPYYVMPYVEGETLRDRLDRDSQLPIDDALLIAREVADALSYAHSHDVVHRDIKPENILLSSGHALVADFGIARAITEAGGDRLTETGLSIGTPSYMSPEQAAAEKSVDGKSDIYSLGCVLYEMLAGEPPHTGPNAQAIITKRLTEPVTPLRTTRETIPPEIDEALRKALARVPADRYATAADFGSALVPAAITSGATPAPSPMTGRSPWTPAILGTLALVAVVVTVVLLARGTPPAPPTNQRPTLAVLPFENLGAPENEYFADGITEEMTSRLAEISALAVTSRTTTVQYKGTDKTLRDIGAELGVQYVLEGTVRTDRAPDGDGQVRVTPQLIRVSDDTHLWTDRFTASLAPGEIFDVQARIAEQVATALNITLLGSEREALRDVPTTDPDAHDAYLLGRFHWNQRLPEDLIKAVAHFRAAIGRDSGFALAWAGLADAFLLYPFYMPDSTWAAAWMNAEDAARQAISLQPDLVQARASLALILTYGARDFPAAEREFQRAIELDSTYPVAHYWYAELLIIQGRSQEAVQHAARATVLAPTEFMTHHMLSHAFLNAGDVPAAERAARLASELRPEYPYARQMLAKMALDRNDTAAAVREMIAGGIAQDVARAIVRARVEPSRTPEAVRAIEAERLRQPGRPSFEIAFRYGLIEAVDSAVAWLARGLTNRETTSLFWIRQPMLGSAVHDNRLAALRERLGLRP